VPASVAADAAISWANAEVCCVDADTCSAEADALSATDAASSIIAWILRALFGLARSVVDDRHRGGRLGLNLPVVPTRQPPGPPTSAY
jgi:hypothetical protein